MPTTAWPAAGTIFAIDETGTGTYTTLNGITSLTNLGGGSVAQAKTTNLASSAHTYKQTIPDNAEVSVSLQWDPTDAVHKFILAAKNTAASGPYSFKATYATGTTVCTSIFSANVSEFSGPDADDVESTLTAEVTLKITGAITTSP